ncbi:hypothetical protein FOL47_007145 [Perkinsus chesapeaki]|uniref:Ketoreductase domain-containing protein n=1 Tax=Perkinsus chesapeaki TaxID=330153 RepID=A0A7J6LMG2_PERCH|nr:hypothetical protein FOL47_007145 [Perkinsus chesapeaki]
MSVAYDFLNRSFVVTGAGKGIGRDITVSLLRNNARVLAVSRTRTDLEDLYSTLEHDTAAKLSHLAADVSDHNVFEAALRDQLDEVEKVHGLVNCAGIARLDPLLEMTSEKFDEHMDTNVGGAFVATKVVGAIMKKQGIKGSIVNISSQASSIALPYHTGYCVSKAGLDMLTKMTALELGPMGIRCNSVCPTVVMTPMGTRVWGLDEKAKPMRDRIPLGRFADMSEVTAAVMYLLSDASSMTTGAVTGKDSLEMWSLISQRASVADSSSYDRRESWESIDEEEREASAIGGVAKASVRPSSISRESSVPVGVDDTYDLSVSYAVGPQGSELLPRDSFLSPGKARGAGSWRGSDVVLDVKREEEEMLSDPEDDSLEGHDSAGNNILSAVLTLLEELGDDSLHVVKGAIDRRLLHGGRAASSASAAVQGFFRSSDVALEKLKLDSNLMNKNVPSYAASIREVVEKEPDIAVKRRYTFGVSNLVNSHNRNYLMLMPKYRDRLYDFISSPTPSESSEEEEPQLVPATPVREGSHFAGARILYVGGGRSSPATHDMLPAGGAIGAGGITTPETPARPRAPPPPQAADELPGVASTAVGAFTADAGDAGGAGGLFLDWAAASLQTMCPSDEGDIATSPPQRTFDSELSLDSKEHIDIFVCSEQTAFDKDPLRGTLVHGRCNIAVRYRIYRDPSAVFWVNRTCRIWAVVDGTHMRVHQPVAGR